MKQQKSREHKETHILIQEFNIKMEIIRQNQEEALKQKNISEIKNMIEFMNSRIV